MSDEVYYKHQDLCSKYGAGSPPVGGKNPQYTVTVAYCAVAAILDRPHTTKLKDDGVVEARFSGGYRGAYIVEMDKELTEDTLLHALVGQVIEVNPTNHPDHKWYVNCMAPSGSSCSPYEDPTLARAFIKDPLGNMPPQLAKQVKENLAKKVKSINKRVRNYSSEKNRREQGRKSRAVTSLTKLLADLCPESQALVVQAMRDNKRVTNEQGYEVSSLHKLYYAIGTVLQGNNEENWCSEDVISEAERLAGVHAVMNQ
jgi:hypothetical protein